jgi:hypothetical protein
VVEIRKHCDVRNLTYSIVAMRGIALTASLQNSIASSAHPSLEEISVSQFYS